MTLFGLTEHYNFKLIDFNVATWHDDEYDNWRAVDAILFNFIGISGILGVWQNSTGYNVSDKVVDPELGTIWTCLVNHVSAATPTIFVTDRDDNPTFWQVTGAEETLEVSRRAATEAKTAAGIALQALNSARAAAADAAASAATIDEGNTILLSRVFS